MRLTRHLKGSLSLRLVSKLNLAAHRNSLAHSTKGTPSQRKGCSDCLWAHGFRYCFTPLSGCFSPFPHGTGSLSVSREYLALRDGPRCFTQDFSCPALLRIPLGFAWLRIRSCHALWLYFPEHSAHQLSCHDVVLQPHTCRNMGGLGCSPFARQYWGNHCLFSFPAGTKMFQFPALAFHIVEWYLFKVPGCPIRKSADQRSFAPTRSLSQLITSFIASESQGIRHVPLLTFCLTDHVWSIYTFSF